MRILALETASPQASVALLADSRPLATAEIRSPRRAAGVLAPTIRQLAADLDWPLSSIELIALTNGPGSFTGLRIGVTTAKLLAYALQADLVALDTLEVVAAQCGGPVERLSVVMDALRGECFSADFKLDELGQPVRLSETVLGRTETWLARLTPETTVTGPGLERLKDALPPAIRLVDRPLWGPTATTVGRLGLARLAAGQRIDPSSLLPRYYRGSYAEDRGPNVHS